MAARSPQKALGKIPGKSPRRSASEMAAACLVLAGFGGFALWLAVLAVRELWLLFLILAES